MIRRIAVPVLGAAGVYLGRAIDRAVQLGRCNLARSSATWNPPAHPRAWGFFASQFSANEAAVFVRAHTGRRDPDILR